MKEFKPGDRVIVYMQSHFNGVAVRRATVEAPGAERTPKGHLAVWICLDSPIEHYDCDGSIEETSRLWVHAKQCRRLKPKQKAVKVTREQLAKAWDEHVVGKSPCYYPMISMASEPFKAMAKALGL